MTRGNPGEEPRDADRLPPEAAAGAGEPARALLERLLAACVQADASDLHLSPDHPPYLRIHGVLDPVPGWAAIPSATLTAVAEELRGDLDAAPLQGPGSLDGARTSADGVRFRFNIFRAKGKYSVALRRLEERFRSLSDLGLPDSLYELCDLSDGLVVVAGPTGAGKSTTLATLIDRINKTRRAHIVTVEDPIEYLHQTAKSLVNQRQIGSDAGSFNDALVASLRQDPDVILVGEIRDLATIRTAITAAETGHLVFTTVHAGDCVGTVERLVSVFPADEQNGIRRQLALVLRAIVAQHLLVADGERRKQPEGGATVRRRRVAASEVLMNTGAVGNLIATGKSAQIYSSMEMGGALGMQTLEENLARLWAAGHISERSAVAAARNPAILRERHARLAGWSGGGGGLRGNGEAR